MSLKQTLPWFAFTSSMAPCYNSTEDVEDNILVEKVWGGGAEAVVAVGLCEIRMD